MMEGHFPCELRTYCEEPRRKQDNPLDKAVAKSKREMRVKLGPGGGSGGGNRGLILDLFCAENR